MRADFSLDYDVLTVEQPQKLYLMARLESGPAPGDMQRRPLNVSLVIDRSGSMAGLKIDYTRQAAKFLVQNLGIKDRLSIVLYNEQVQTLLNPEFVQRKDTINQMVENIKAGGTTNLSGGWLEGCNHVAANLSKDALNRVILMSDGLANRGVTDMDQLLALARQKHSQGISTTTMGLGDDFNEDLMTRMADEGGGAYYFIESPEVAPLIFKEELQGLLNVVGQNLVISVVPTKHVASVKQLNTYQMSSDGHETSFRLGDIFGEELKTLVIEVEIPALSDIGHVQIATLRFEYDELLEDGTAHRVWEMPVMVNIQKQLRDQKLLADPDVSEAVFLLKAAEARRKAVQEADKGNFEQASSILRTVAESLSERDFTNVVMKEEYDALIKQADEMKSGGEYYSKYNRKTMITQSFHSSTGRHQSTQALRSRELMREMGMDTDVNVTPKPGVTPTHVTFDQQVFALTADLIRLGRASQNEIPILKGGVSRFHSQIKREGDKLILEDLDSTNGTRVNGKKIDSPHELSIGDVVQIGDAKLIFHDNSQ